MVSVIRYSDVPGESRWLIGFAWAPVPAGGGWALPFLNLVGWTQTLQATVPVTVGALLLRASRHRRDAVAAGF
jgi:hypothetical protein